MKTQFVLKSTILIMSFDSAFTSWHFDGPNIARNKTTRQGPESYQPGKFLANLAVDGVTNNQFWGGSCSHTKEQSSSDAFWTVDLGSTYYIYGIRIYNRDTYKRRLENFTIYGDADIGNLLYDDNKNNQYYNDIITIPLNPTQKYRNITIHVPRHDSGPTILTLCEVQIFGEEQYACKTQTILNGKIQLLSGNEEGQKYSRGTLLGFFCSQGYRLQGASTATCFWNGTFSEHFPLCVHACKVPIVQHGNYNTDGNLDVAAGLLVAVGKTIRLSCYGGYKAEGEQELQCILVDLSNYLVADWDHPAANCKTVTCAPPENIEHGYYVSQFKQNFTTNISIFGTIIVPQCKNRYKLASDDVIRSCNETGQWTGNKPICKIIKCNPPDKIANAKFQMLNKSDVPDKLDIGSIIWWQCDDNFLHSDGSEYQLCDVTGSWNGSTPVCAPVHQRSLQKVAAIGGATFAGLIFLNAVVVVFIFKCRRTRPTENYSKVIIHGHDFPRSGTMCTEIDMIPERGGTRNTQSLYLNPLFCELDAEDSDYVNCSTWNIPGTLKSEDACAV